MRMITTMRNRLYKIGEERLCKLRRVQEKYIERRKQRMGMQIRDVHASDDDTIDPYEAWHVADLANKRVLST